VAFVKQAGEIFSLGALSLPRRFEQRFLNVPRHIAPHLYCSPAQQVREAFVTVGHVPSELRADR
jgi:hypothetical protein